MRKSRFLVSMMLVLAMIFGLSAFTIAGASSSGSSSLTADDWRPMRYFEGGSKVPTEMIVNNNGTLTFTGSKNASYGSTGFMINKPIEDITNFDIDLDLTVPDVDKILWISFGFLDKGLVKGDNFQEVTEIAQPFNAVNVYNGYQNDYQKGAVFQLWPMAESSVQGDIDAGIDFKNNNTMRVVFAEKTLDCRGTAGISQRLVNQDYNAGDSSTYANGYGLQQGKNGVANQCWHELDRDFVKYIKFDGANLYDQGTSKFNLKFSIDPWEDGVKLNVNNGAWKAYNGTQYNETWGQLNLSDNNKLKGFKNYFTQNDCYFSFVIKYMQSETQDRTISVTVNSINGSLPNETLAQPTFDDDKVFTKDNIKMNIETDDIGVFGVYPYQLTGLKVTEYDDADDFYYDVESEASRLNMDILNYMTIEPAVGNKAVKLARLTPVEYTLQDDYVDAKVYYVTTDDEFIELEGATVEDGVVTFSIDNKTVKKVAVFGSKTAGGNTNNGGANGGANADNTEDLGGCGSAISGVIALPLIATGAFIAIKKRKNDK